MRRTRRAIRGLLLLFPALVLGGCAASFSGNELERIDTLDLNAPETPKPSAYFDVSWMTRMGSGATQNIPAKRRFAMRVERIAGETGMFSEVVMTQPSTPRDYTFEVSMVNHGSAMAARCCGSISGATLTIIPAYARDNYTLTAVAYDASGTEIGSYQYDDHLNSWIWLPLLPIAPFTENAGEKLRDNMLRHFFQDLSRGGLVTSSGL